PRAPVQPHGLPPAVAEGEVSERDHDPPVPESPRSVALDDTRAARGSPAASRRERVRPRAVGGRAVRIVPVSPRPAHRPFVQAALPPVAVELSDGPAPLRPEPELRRRLLPAS